MSSVDHTGDPMDTMEETVTLGMDPELLQVACDAVAGAARPSLVRALPVASREDVAAFLHHRITEHTDLPRIQPWYAAFGEQCTRALMDLRQVDRSLASHITGVALQAQFSARASVDPATIIKSALGTDAVIRLGEEALVWVAGRYAGSVE